MKLEQMPVNKAALKTLLLWCEDAIDFKNESDDDAASAFDKIWDDVDEQGGLA